MYVFKVCNTILLSCYYLLTYIFRQIFSDYEKMHSHEIPSIFFKYIVLLIFNCKLLLSFSVD